MTRTEVLTVPVPAYRELPAALTAPIPAPPPPPSNCVDERGQSGVCALDGLATIPAWSAALETCNADRRRAALLGATDAQD